MEQKSKKEIILIFFLRLKATICRMRFISGEFINKSTEHCTFSRLNQFNIYGHRSVLHPKHVQF